MSYSLQTTRALDTMWASLAAVSRQSQSFAPGEETLAAIREQMTGTAGHQQALEHLATLAGLQAQEQLLTRQSLAVVANAQTVANGYWLLREVQGQATLEVLLHARSRPGRPAGGGDHPSDRLPARSVLGRDAIRSLSEPALLLIGAFLRIPHSWAFTTYGQEHN
jgi:hypothetical protein